MVSGVEIGKAALWLKLIRAQLRAPGPPDILATSMDLCTNAGIATLLGADPALASRLLGGRPQTVVGWGRRPSGRRAEALARRMEARCLLVEDGFLRSAGRDGPALSYVLDDLGIYYDATAPSRFETLVQRPLSPDDVRRAERIALGWRDHGLSKYVRPAEAVPDRHDPYVLVLDQAAGDLSISFGLASPDSFRRMLDAALAENPDRTVVVKLHPDTALGRRRGHFGPELCDQHPRIRVIGGERDTARLIAGADRVYSVTSQGGFEALIHGRPLRCFGMPFYAGWGLSEDDLAAPGRRSPASMAQLVHAALVAYPRYLDPVTGRECDVETSIDYMASIRNG